MKDGRSIGEVAEVTGVTVHTLRYYERIGLLPRVGRMKGGQRSFSEKDVNWVVFLRKLHATGMPIRRMLEYARLARKGDETTRERREILDAHRMVVEAKLAELQTNLEVIRMKIALYDGGEELPTLKRSRTG